MAYSVSWDEGVPVGATTPAADIDTELQSVKTSLRERLEQVLPDFDDDLLDPKLIAIQEGLLSARDANPAYAGQMYFAEDVATLYIGNAALEWVSTGGLPEEGDDTAISTTSVISAKLSANHVVTVGGTWNTLSGWTAEVQSSSFYTGAAPTRFTIPSSGTYVLDASLSVYTGGYDFEFAVAKDGNLPDNHLASANTQGASGIASVSWNYAMVIQANQYLEFKVRNLGIVLQTVYGVSYSHIRIARLL